MSVRRRAWVLGLSAVLLACDPIEPSDQGQYSLHVGLSDPLANDARRVLVGSQFELYIRALAVDGELDSAAADDLPCATRSASGVLTKLGDEFHVDAAGPGAVELAAPSESCPNTTLAELGPDSWTMTGVDASDAVGRWMPTGDHAALYWDLSPGPARVWPEALGLPLTTARVAAEGRFTLAPALVERDAGDRAAIRWHDPDEFLDVPAHYRELAGWVDEQGETQAQDFLDGRLHAGERFSSSVTILAHAFALPEVRAVPTEEIASLELVPIYWPDDAQIREWGPPVGVIAITRDDQGRRIVGAPLQWEVTRGRVSAMNLSFGDDVLELGDCREAPRDPQWRGATIEASIGELVRSVELEWIALPTDETDPTSPECSASACACTSQPRPSDSALASLALVVLGLGIRRRQRSRRSSAASTAPR